MFEGKSIDELIAKSMGLKQEEMAIHTKRLEIADELRLRRALKEIEKLSPQAQALLNRPGNVTVTPAPAVLRAEGK